MKPYGAIDLRSANNVTVPIDGQDKGRSMIPQHARQSTH
jgi:hypothetical protein